MVPVFLGQSRVYEFYRTMFWCPAKFGIGHQMSQGCPSRKNTLLTMPKKAVTYPQWEKASTVVGQPVRWRNGIGRGRYVDWWLYRVWNEMRTMGNGYVKRNQYVNWVSGFEQYCYCYAISPFVPSAQSLAFNVLVCGWKKLKTLIITNAHLCCLQARSITSLSSI